MKTSIILTSILLYCQTSTLLARWYHHEENVMGTQGYLEFWSEDEALAKRVISEVFSAMHAVNKQMSPYLTESELSKINRLAHETPLKISKNLFELIQFAQAISAKSEGAFDITFASVGYLYDYRNATLPDSKTVTALKDAINFRNIILDEKEHTIFFTHKKTKIDLGGIAKGYAIDRSTEVLKNLGIEHALVKAGGDSRILGDKRGRPWMIAIKHPRKTKAIASKIPLVNVSVSTSGDYERYFIKDGVRYHHIIDPSNASSSRASQSVTILASSSTLADALSTTVFILGYKKGLDFINSQSDVSAIIIDDKGKLHFSADLMMRN